MLVLALPVSARDFVVSTPDVYQALIGAGWELSEPRYSPDSTEVLFDKPGNVDFSAAEKTALDSAGVTRIPESVILWWMEENGWVE